MDDGVVCPRNVLPLDASAQDDLELALGQSVDASPSFRPYALRALDNVIARPGSVRGTVTLTDLEGASLAKVSVVRFDTASFTGGPESLVTDVLRLGRRATRPFEAIYRPAMNVAGWPGGWLVVPTDAPLTANDVALIRQRAGDRRVLVLALAGAGRPREVSAAGLIRSCVSAAPLLGGAEVVAVPLARHEDDRDLDAALYREVVNAYSPGGEHGRSEVFEPSHDGPFPPEVAAAVDLEQRRGISQGLVVFFTGLSGSGKSTVAQGVRNALVEAGERPIVTLLDGDVVRTHLSKGLGFSREDRDSNVQRIGWVAAEIARHGGTAIASPIAPFASTRDAVRAMVTDAGGEFVLVHVATPLAECERRDRKGLYARARAGEIPDFTGISSTYEEPDDPDVRIDTTGRSVGDCVAVVLDELAQRGLIGR